MQISSTSNRSRTRRLAWVRIAMAALALCVLNACSPVTALNALSPGSGLRSDVGLAYGPHGRHKLDIYRPVQPRANAPVVVFFYGGNWKSGERDDYAFVGRALASRGIVAVIPDYRLYPDVHYPDFLDDSAQAVAWTLEHIGAHGGDPARVFLMGHSAGAYNAAMVALDGTYLGKFGASARKLRGWIGLAGPYNFLPIENPTTKLVFDFPGTPPDSQPVRHTGPDAPPALLIAARTDTLVDPSRNTGAMAAQLRAQRVPVTELYYDKVTHVSLVASIAAPLRMLAPTLEQITSFIDSHGQGGDADARYSRRSTTAMPPAPASAAIAPRPGH